MKTDFPAIRIVIAGLGLVGKRHADAIRQVPEMELVGIVDTDDAARQYAVEHDLTWYSTLEGMFNDTRLDGVILATPTPLHVEQGRLCVDNQCPVLIEKPLATSAEQAASLVDSAQRAGVPILVGHHRRHNPLVQKARSLIDEGAIGNIRAVHSTCWFYKPDQYFADAPWRTRTGAGPVSVNLVHDVDLIRYLCGDVISVSAQSAPSSRGFENEEVAAAVLQFCNGAIGTITVSDGIVSPWSWEMTAREYPVYPPTQESSHLLGGTLGSLSVPDLTLWNQNGEQDWWKPINATTMPRPVSDPLVNQLVHFASVIRGEQTPLVSGCEGLKTLRVIEAIQSSAKSGSTITLAR